MHPQRTYKTCCKRNAVPSMPSVGSRWRAWCRQAASGISASSESAAGSILPPRCATASSAVTGCSVISISAMGNATCIAPWCSVFSSATPDLPQHSRPILITDAGFKASWFKLCNRLKFDWVGRIRNRDMIRPLTDAAWGRLCRQNRCLILHRWRALRRRLLRLRRARSRGGGSSAGVGAGEALGRLPSNAQVVAQRQFNFSLRAGALYPFRTLNATFTDEIIGNTCAFKA